MGNNPKLHLILGHKPTDIMTISLMLVATTTFNIKLEKEGASSIWKHKVCSNKINKTRKPTTSSLSMSITLTNACYCYKQLIRKLKTTLWRWVHNNQQTKCIDNLKTNEQQTKQKTNCRTIVDLKMTMWRWAHSEQQTKFVDNLKTNER